MEKLLFSEKNSNHRKTGVVRVSKWNHGKLVEISQKAKLPISTVANRLLEFALSRVEWEEE